VKKEINNIKKLIKNINYTNKNNDLQLSLKIFKFLKFNIPIYLKLKNNIKFELDKSVLIELNKTNKNNNINLDKIKNDLYYNNMQIDIIDYDNFKNLDFLFRKTKNIKNILKNKEVSQAYLKMKEIIYETKLFDNLKNNIK
jgi:hypothetical protein